MGKIIYHGSDLDGRCSAAIIYHYYKKQYEYELIPMEYDKKFDFKLLTKGETVFVVDFSFSVEEMKALKEYTNLIWIDHHKSAIDRLKNLNIKGAQEIGKAACELCWEWVYKKGQFTPYAIKLIGRYDVWDHTDINVIPYQYAAKSQEGISSPGSKIWEEVLKDLHTQQFILEGKIIEKYVIQEYKELWGNNGYKGKFEEYQALIINANGGVSSKIFEYSNQDTFDINLKYTIKNNIVRCSLYSKTVDVSILATKYGGGGHKGAAGFSLKVDEFFNLLQKFNKEDNIK